MFLADANATADIGHRIAQILQPGDVIGLSGPLGAGKSVLAKGLVAALGFAGDVPSPTFNIVIPYAPPDTRVQVWHVDLYRLEDAAEIEELGLDDARCDTALMIEWPERLGMRLWPDTLLLSLEMDGEGRRLTARIPASWEARWPFR